MNSNVKEIFIRDDIQFLDCFYHDY